MPRAKRTTTDRSEGAGKGKAKGRRYVLTLYIGSMNARARFAIENIEKICKEHLKDCYELEVVDVREDPSRTVKDEITVTPMLVKKLPLPLKTFIGNMADIDKVLVGLELKPKDKAKK